MTLEQLTAKLSKLSPQQQQELALKVKKAKIQKASENLLYFLANFVQTLDEHDQQNAIKKLPMEKEYLKELAGYFLSEQLLIIEKSRQMMVTWLMCACHLWDAMFHEGRRIFFQSKKEKDANANVDRVKFIYDHLPELMRQMYPADPYSYLTLSFSKKHSIIQGTPQGADVLRQYTSSRIFSDETAFQDKAEEAWVAAKPTLTGGGSIVMVSSPNFKNFFYCLAYDVVQ